MAIKIQNLKEISTIEKDINEEYRILRDLSSHSNLPDFYGAFTNNNGVELWFVMEVRRIGHNTYVYLLTYCVARSYINILYFY